GPRHAPMAKTTAWTARITAAAVELNPAAIRVATITTVVTQAANRGPRTSTAAAWVVVDMEADSCCVGGAGDEQAESAAPSERAKTAQLRSAATTTATTRNAA